MQLRVAGTAELSGAELAVVRRLLDEEFGGRFTDDDWDHTVGGTHVLALDGHQVLAHAAVVARTLVASGRTLDTGYVEGLATRGDQRRRGHASLVMRETSRIIQQRYQLGALADGTGIPGFYQRLGWEIWQGPTFVASPLGPLRTTEEDGGVLVLRTPATPDLDLTGPLTCDWRSGDVW